MVTVLAVVLSPAVTGHDSFPLSSYPMYAFQRSRTDRFQAVLGESSTGEVKPLSLRLVADTDDPLIAEALVAQAIGSGTVARLCEQVAGRVGPGIERVLVVEEVHDVIERARRAPSLQDRVVHAACTVRR